MRARGSREVFEMTFTRVCGECHRVRDSSMHDRAVELLYPKGVRKSLSVFRDNLFIFANDNEIFLVLYGNDCNFCVTKSK